MPGQDEAPKALVYRGPAGCPGCSEAVAKLLQTSPSKIQTTYVGPNETTQLTVEALKGADMYVQPGGGDLDDGWPEMKQHKSQIQSFVLNGGKYIGICLGAYMAAHDPGFDLLPPKDDTDSECEQPKAQVTNPEKDTIIQIDWSFTASGKKRTEKDRWMYFQDGAVIELHNDSKTQVLGRYSANGDVAATLGTYGKGVVGLIGTHPEADQSWYDDITDVNPDGIRFDIGHDFVEAVVKAGPSSSKKKR